MESLKESHTWTSNLRYECRAASCWFILYHVDLIHLNRRPIIFIIQALCKRKAILSVSFLRRMLRMRSRRRTVCRWATIRSKLLSATHRRTHNSSNSSSSRNSIRVHSAGSHAAQLSSKEWCARWSSVSTCRPATNMKGRRLSSSSSSSNNSLPLEAKAVVAPLPARAPALESLLPLRFFHVLLLSAPRQQTASRTRRFENCSLRKSNVLYEEQKKKEWLIPHVIHIYFDVIILHSSC